MADLNPRNLREKLGPFVGKKVVIGTKDLHYVSGKLEEIARNQLRVSVAGQIVTIPAENVENIKEAHALQAEYIK